MLKYLLPLTVCLSCFSSLFSQDDGYLQFIGHNYFNNKGLLHTEVKVLNAGTTYSVINTGNSKDFKLALNYGAIYDIYFYNDKTQAMFLRVTANEVPEKKYNLLSTYDLQIPFFPKDSKDLDTIKFRQPFHRIHFNGKNKFVDDTTYMNAFLRNVYLQPKEEVEDTIPKPPPIIVMTQPQTGTLVGNVLYDSKDKTPVQNRTVVLETKDGKELASVQTTRSGTFVFQAAKLSEAYRIKVKFDGIENGNGQKIIINNSNNETLDKASVSEAKANFENTGQNDLIKRLVDNSFAYKIAGKLASSDGSGNKMITEKTVYLLDKNGNIVQRVKTNALGVFLFTNIKPNINYVVAVDESDCGIAPGSKLIVYNSKGKKLTVIDSISKSRFVYHFLSTSGAEFNELLVDDSDLKMNVKGKVFGNNANNPLSAFKILLMNDKFETIDTAITTNDGSFTFTQVPYNRQVVISADNDANILEALNNIMVYDNDANLIKIVSLIKGGKFNYRPLQTEQSRLVEYYLDDPWLSYIDKKYQKNGAARPQVIIENINFDFNKSEILPEGRQSLDKVILALQLNPKITIVLGAHTDSKGSDTYNLKLSESRANSAKQYLVQNGISENRIKSIGYGESKLLNGCDNKTICPEEEHAKNRRLEFALNLEQ